MEATSKRRATHWQNWTSYVRPLRVDPLLQGVPYTTRVRCLTGFAARIRRGGFNGGRRVKAETVSSAITSVGQEISLACDENPTKRKGSDKFVPRLAQALDGWRKEDPPINKMLPVEADVPELIVKWGQMKGASPLLAAVGDWCLIAFYFLLRIGEYTTKGTRNESKQTVQFRMQDVTFFKKDKVGRLRQLPRNARDATILTADGATLTLGNQKNGWQNVSIHHEWNGEDLLDAVRALGRRYCHIRQHMNNDWSTLLSAVFTEDGRVDVTDKDVSQSLKTAARVLQYPEMKGIPVERVNTHSLRIGGANALALAGFNEMQIQKMGRWRGDTFKIYVREQLSNFSEGMSRAMKQSFGFVNVEGGVLHDITPTVLAMPYNVGVSDGAAAA